VQDTFHELARLTRRLVVGLDMALVSFTVFDFFAAYDGLFHRAEASSAGTPFSDALAVYGCGFFKVSVAEGHAQAHVPMYLGIAGSAAMHDNYCSLLFGT